MGRLHNWFTARLGWLARTILRTAAAVPVVVLTGSCYHCSAQANGENSVTQAIAAVVDLDSVTITASRTGFSVDDFIDLVRSDISLYQAFRNLREVTCRFNTDMTLENRKSKNRSTYSARNRQFYDGSCRWMEVIHEQIEGPFFKGRKQKERFYTFELYRRVFVTEDTVCNSIVQQNAVPGDAGDVTNSRIEALKQLIFYPGSRADVPFIGSKTEIFSERMTKRYQYSISSDTLNGIAVYIFDARARPSDMQPPNKTVFKSLRTVFARSDFQVISRTYRLAYDQALFDFDVTMEVDLLQMGDRYFPEKVVYTGEWNIATKRREKGSFTIMFSDYE